MYARLCAISTTTSVCLLCKRLLRFRVIPSTSKRRYAAEAALAPRPAGPSHHGSLSTTIHVSPSSKSSTSGKGLSRLDAVAKAERATQKASERAATVGRKAMKAAEEAERRRKALAILDKTTKFIAAGKDSLHEPTLADLERFKPKQPPLITLKFIYPDPSSRLHRGSPADSVVERYSVAFQQLVDTLSKRFRRKQLLKLYKEGKRIRTGAFLGTPRPLDSLKTPREVAEEIVRWLWHWPYVKEVNERKTYLTTRSDRVFPITTSEFFLLLGSDGSSLLALTESYEVVVKRVERTGDAFYLVLEGPNYMLDRLAADLIERKQTIISELIHVGSSDQTSGESHSYSRSSSIRSDLVQKISKLSNALVEDRGSGIFRISAHHARDIVVAIRLITCASHQDTLPSPPLLVHLPTLRDSTPGLMFPHTYAFFPFELSNADALPWTWTSTGALSLRYQSSSHNQDRTPSSSGNPCLFRVRKVSEWLGQNPTNTVNQFGGLREGVGRLINSTGQPQALREVLGLLDLNPSNSHGSRQRKITASTGHVVFSPALRFRSTLSPPLRGSWVFPKLLDWMRLDTGRVTFVPSPPQSLIDSPSTDRAALNRLVYRSPSPIPADSTSDNQVSLAGTSRTLRFEVMLPQPASDKGKSDPAAHSVHAEPNWDGADVLDTTKPMYDDESALSVQQSALGEESANIQSEENMSAMSRITPSVETQPEDSPRLWSGVESFVNVMLPDRPMDMQFSSFDSTPVSRKSEPLGLQLYASNLLYYLKFSDAASPPDPPLRITHEGIGYVLDMNATVRWSNQVVADDSTDKKLPIDVITENVVDLESNRKVFACQVTCYETNAIPTWRKFLGDCDRLTSLTAKNDTSPVLFPKEEAARDLEEKS